MPDFKLANVLLHVDDHLSSFPEVLYRADGTTFRSSEDGSLGFGGSLDFLTYFNGISCSKWRQYADVSDIRLHLELAGDPCTIGFSGVGEHDVSAADAPSPALNNGESAVKAPVSAKALGDAVVFGGSSEFVSFDLVLPAEGLLLGGFTLASSGTTKVKNAYWYTAVPAERIRDIRLALATTTFRKEEYIVPNIQAVKDHILSCDDPISTRFHLFVVDNGKTLDAQGLSSSGVTVIPNANVGGSGGFARGMMAALESDTRFTHVLLMDDDVRVSPESIIRTFNLLSLANDRYRCAFINGAMLQLERPNMQFEDVSFVRSDGAYERCKGNLFIDNLADAAVNEAINVEVPQAYGAWWYACIPLSAVREHGLPLPLFVRCDDVEYGMRCSPTYMTMNGICVWHEGFGGRFRAAVDCYQYVRNYLVMIACNGKSSDKLFMMRTERNLRIYLRTMAYETAELIVSGLEDYLKGPEFLMHANGEAVLKGNSAKNERLLPLHEALSVALEIDPSLAEGLEGFKPDMRVLGEDEHVGTFLKLWRTMPYDRHLLPDALLGKKPATVFYGGSTVLAREQAATRVLVACDREGENAHVRIMDRGRYKAIKTRWRAAKADYLARKGELQRAYQDALPEMTSIPFWEEYLKAAAEPR